MRRNREIFSGPTVLFPETAFRVNPKWFRGKKVRGLFDSPQKKSPDFRFRNFLAILPRNNVFFFFFLSFVLPIIIVRVHMSYGNFCCCPFFFGQWFFEFCQRKGFQFLEVFPNSLVRIQGCRFVPSQNMFGNKQALRHRMVVPNMPDLNLGVSAGFGGFDSGPNHANPQVWGMACKKRQESIMPWIGKYTGLVPWMLWA